MKVDRPGGVRGTSAPKRTQKSRAAGGSSFADALSGAPESEGAEPVAPVTGVAGVLAAQEVGGEGEQKRRAVKRGTDLLGRLDEIRLALLGGGLPKSRLDELARMVSQKREEVSDPQLSALLDEIDLRVQVELAKWAKRA